MGLDRVEETVDRAFAGSVKADFGLKYLEMLHATWSEAIRALRRTVLLLTALVVAFLLLDHAKGAEFSLGPLRTNNVSAILILLPAAISFCLFEALDLTLAGSYYRDVAGALVKKLYPTVYENNLELLLAPATTFAWGVGMNTGLSPQASKGIPKLLMGINLAMVLVFIASAGLFLAYAYVRLFGNDDANMLGVVASLIFTIFNLVRTGLIVADDFSE